MGSFPETHFQMSLDLFFSIRRYHFANKENDFLRISREYDVLFEITNNDEPITL